MRIILPDKLDNFNIKKSFLYIKEGLHKIIINIENRSYLLKSKSICTIDEKF